MRDRTQHYLATVFVLLGVVAAGAMVAMAGGWLRIDSELLGLAVGGVLVLLLAVAVVRR